MKRFIRISLLVAVLFNFVSFVHAQVNSDSLLPTNQKGITIKHTYYTLSYSETDNQAEWVAYYLTPASINGLQKRSSKFLPDPLLSNPLGPNSYTKSGYDRGHLCPAA
ncbi:MAG: hypothetical protein RL731_30, partial [Bacteroidota bacterium]